jgi:hypothetical protein
MFTEIELKEAAELANLAILANAMGFDGVSSDFVAFATGKVGAFSRWAMIHSVDIGVAVAAKREFIAAFVPTNGR